MDSLLAASQLLAKPAPRRPASPAGVRSHKLDQAGLEQILAERLAGDSLRVIGRRVGLTGERIRQLLDVVEPDHTAKSQAARRRLNEQAKDAATVAKAAEAEAAGRECVICYGTLVAAPSRVTCGDRCAELYLLTAYHLDEEKREKRRQASARWVVANAHRVTSYQLRYARGVLAGTTERRGRWVNSDEIRDALLEVARLRGQDLPAG